MMRPWVPTLAVTLVLANERAEACSCPSPAIPPIVEESVLPSTAPIMFMPPEAFVIKGYALLDASGNSIQVRKSEIIIAGTALTLLVYLPTVPLEEGATYQFALYGRFTGAAEEEFDIAGRTILVGPPPTALPEVPVVLDVQYRVSTASEVCGPSSYATLELKTDPYVLLVDRDGAATFDAESMSGSVNAMVNNIGTGICENNWPEAGWGAQSTVRVGALDEGGQFSGWSDPTNLQFPDAPSEPDASGASQAGCAIARPREIRSNGWLFVFAAGVAATFGRRRALEDVANQSELARCCRRCFRRSSNARAMARRA